MKDSLNSKEMDKRLIAIEKKISAIPQSVAYNLKGDTNMADNKETKNKDIDAAKDRCNCNCSKEELKEINKTLRIIAQEIKTSIY